MNEELCRLLARAGIGSEPDGWRWDRIILTSNRGPISARIGNGDSRPGEHGFDCLLLDEEFEPSYYLKVRPVDDRRLRRESAILEALSRDAAVAATVPRTLASTSERMRVQLTAYVDGPPFARVLPALRPSQWARSVQEVLEIGEHLVARAPVLLPALAPGKEPVAVAVEARSALDHLVTAGLLDESEPHLRRALEDAGAVPPRVQHGDFWPANLVRGEEGWKVLDFEDFGRIRIPLYDAFHMLRTSDLIRRGAPADASWIDRLREGDAVTAATRKMIRNEAERLGLSPVAVSGAFLFYLLDLAYRFHRRSPPPSYWEPLVGDLRRAGRLLRSGRSLEALLLPP